MIKRLIIFLVRKRLGLDEGELFRFAEQKSSSDYYYFTKDAVMKCHNGKHDKSSVSLNWLLDDECKIKEF